MDTVKKLQELKEHILEKDAALTELKASAKKLRKTEQAQNRILTDLKPTQEQRRKSDPKEFLSLQARMREHSSIMIESGRLAALQEAEAELMMLEIEDLQSNCSELVLKGRSNYLHSKECEADAFFKSDLGAEHLETLLALAGNTLNSFKEDSRELYLEMLRANMTESEIWARVSGAALIKKVASLVGTANPCDSTGFFSDDLSNAITKNNIAKSNRPSGPLTRKHKISTLKARIESLQAQEG